MTQPDIECVDLVRIFRTKDVEVQALQGLTLRVDAGDMVAVVGASGSGKSTLLSVLSGLDRPSAGRAMVAGHDMLAMKRAERVVFQRSSVGFVWQQTSRNLLPYLSAAENIAAVLAIARGPRGNARAKRVDELLDLLGVADVRLLSNTHRTGGVELRADGLERLGPPSADRNAGTGSRELECRRSPDPGSSAGDEPDRALVGVRRER